MRATKTCCPRVGRNHRLLHLPEEEKNVVSEE